MPPPAHAEGAKASCAQNASRAADAAPRAARGRKEQRRVCWRFRRKRRRLVVGHGRFAALPKVRDVRRRRRGRVRDGSAARRGGHGSVLVVRRLAAARVQHASCSMHRATCIVQRASCNMQRAAYNVRHITTRRPVPAARLRAAGDLGSERRQVARQRVACATLQCVLCCNVLCCVAMCAVLQRVLCCNVVCCVATCCAVLQCALCCNVLCCVAMCAVLQRVVLCCNVCCVTSAGRSHDRELPAPRCNVLRCPGGVMAINGDCPPVVCVAGGSVEPRPSGSHACTQAHSLGRYERNEGRTGAGPPTGP
jgi:hypothetical protein